MKFLLSRESDEGRTFKPHSTNRQLGLHVKQSITNWVPFIQETWPQHVLLPWHKIIRIDLFLFSENSDL